MPSAEFKPGDRVLARLWPELGTGEVLHVSKRSLNTASGVRVARVRWSTGQESTHSFTALKGER